ncbi:FadR/GntR family transcriptional regulator [Alloyangia pacifica]|uniref:DNA-binding transcriptional regulator, FadR family n=1 Tax=Alloyangia pacifica TaxID=311180 RepID=A0A1I6VH56_9RHOB|nr:FadR/GntR family transcriptional regulator [Alloyangia pacifica]SDH97713.1 DNA-binding transcriptional regulator, FadR family [Alloyangia pacifica]SFT12990.1 DNA-binding transcriptional regulator, FadR family [Alloyangia pacifica]
MSEKLAPVSVRRLYRIIADQIIERIRSGQYPEGERIPAERDLAEQLEVSRTSVREALIALEVEGYVEVRIGSGVYVTGKHARQVPVDNLLLRGEDISASGTHPDYAPVGAFELLNVQMLIEPEAAAMAARNGTDDEKQAILDAAMRMENSRMPRLHNRLYHLAIGEATGNAAMAITIRTLWDIHDESVMFNTLEQHVVGRPAWIKAEAEHRAITDAILRGDEDAARRAMIAHTELTSLRLGRDFGSKLPR